MRKIRSEFDFRQKRIIERVCELLGDLFPVEIVDIERVGDGKWILTHENGEKITYESYDDVI